ncbi:MAG: RdgB/HAM1 family non-canonical purine NTP pyrophosphatase [Gammaproteobacteria bacterium]|nr:RdgB/HAM1 family non-canonical purine NTP pyrophosphatase [Gammaproteobacteria bacterium]
MKIIFASSNQGKIKEINALIRQSAIEVIPQVEMGVPDIAETGLTFIENALIKARNATELTKLPAMADDSGLVVPILNGEPGIFSARYAGEAGDHTKNITKLLTKLQDVPPEKRIAYFYCVIVMLRHKDDPCPIICEGIWHGSILMQPKGEKGFGYDPIFYVADYNCSAAELTMEVKNEISHRGQAMTDLIQQLQSL